MVESLVTIERIQEAEGCLIGSGSVLTGESDYQAWAQRLAQEASPGIVALAIKRSASTSILWIDGEILSGKKLMRSFADPSQSPKLSNRVVIARSGTIFGVEITDSIIQSKPKLPSSDANG